MTTWTPTTDDRWPGVEGIAFRAPSGHTATLNDLLALDAYPIRVNADGTIDDHAAVTPPDVYAAVDTNGSYTPTAERDAARDLDRDGWEPMRGYTGQHGAGRGSWLMHASEFVGGRLAADILAEPGVYAAVTITPLTPDETDAEPTEWAVVRRTR